jgi:hypothetical protein
MPTKTEQLYAFLYDKEEQLTMKYDTGLEPYGIPYYSKVFTITKKDIFDYIRKNYTLSNLPFTRSSPSRKDGFYIIPMSDSTGYRIYYQKNCIRSKEIVANNENEALYQYVNLRLLFSISGIEENS